MQTFPRDGGSIVALPVPRPPHLYQMHNTDTETSIDETLTTHDNL